MNRKRMGPWLLALLATVALALCGTAHAGQTQKFEQRAIARVQKTPAKQLDERLPKEPFAAWLRSVIGKEAKLEWEVNDCGEQSGDPELDKGRDFPACVEATATLADKREVHVQVAVGTFGKGFVGQPAVRSVTIVHGDDFTEFKRLSDLPDALRVPASPR